MYQDSRIIYREYIQNSIDQPLNDPNELEINITIDPNKRYISIVDNGAGISKEKIAVTLADVADSQKKKGESIGFRGIGRLGGLAYCDTLRFTTTTKGETEKTIMTWDAKLLNDMLDDTAITDEASILLKKVISYNQEECQADEHFFIVELIGIRNENIDLLEVEDVKEYISLNAPVPFHSNFFYKDKIHKYQKKKNIPIKEYKIFVNSEDILKPYSTQLYKKEKSGNKKSYDEVYNIVIHEFHDNDENLLAWMWYGVSRFETQIPFPLNTMAGIRVRQANIQIGDEKTLIPLFKERRANLYFIGEVHTTHKDLIPNARRDYFNENEIRYLFEGELSYYFSMQLHTLYTDANTIKNSLKKETTLYKKEIEYEQKQGRFINDQAEQKFRLEIESAKKANIKAKRVLERLEHKAEGNEVLKVVFDRIKQTYKNTPEKENIPSSKKNKLKGIKPTIEGQSKKKTRYLVDELSSLPEKQRKLVSRIYEVIQRNLPPEHSEELIEKIQEELKNGKKDFTS